MLAAFTSALVFAAGFVFVLPVALSRSHRIGSRILSSLDDLPDGARLVVLGCHVETSGRPNRLFIARVAAGAGAWHVLATRTDAPPPSILASGHGPLGETDALRDGLVAAGVPEDALRLDSSGERTIHSIECVAGEARPDAPPIVFVTQRFHLPRTLWLADRLGIDAVGLPAEGDIGPPRARLREHIAWLRAFVDTSRKSVHRP